MEDITIEQKNEIMELCDNLGIRKYSINSDGSIDVVASVDISYNDLTEIPIQFNQIRGSFYCNDNKLTSLKGSPKKIGRNFYCSNNQLTSLEHCPHVPGYFSFELNKIPLSLLSEYILMNNIDLINIYSDFNTTELETGIRQVKLINLTKL